MLLETYSPSHMRAIVRQLGLQVVGETSHDFLCLCPFHGNRHTPSFSVSHQKGLYLCFNPSCGVSGTIVELVKEMTHRNEYEALRFIISAQQEAAQHFDEELADILEEKPEFDEFSQSVLDKMYNDVDGGREYFHSRGINDESIDHFRLGYSKNQGMVIVPVHSPDGLPVGLVGRSVEGKSFKNSTRLPRNKTMFNIHRAKRLGGSVVVVESSFDAIRLHQVGLKAVATLGATVSRYQISLLQRYATSIIICPDNDNAGIKMIDKIVSNIKDKSVEVINLKSGKDVGDLNDSEIKNMFTNAGNSLILAV